MNSHSFLGKIKFFKGILYLLVFLIMVSSIMPFASASGYKTIWFKVVDLDGEPLANVNLDTFASLDPTASYTITGSYTTDDNGFVSLTLPSEDYVYFLFKKWDFESYWPIETYEEIGPEGPVIRVQSIESSQQNPINIYMDTRPVIWTDKSSYAPGETVTIYGTGFEDEYVQIKITNNGRVFLDNIQIDENSRFEYSYTPEGTGEFTVEILSPNTSPSSIFNIFSIFGTNDESLALTTFTGGDPLVTFRPTDDVYVFGQYPTTNYNRKNLYVSWYKGCANGKRRIYLKFDVGSIPECAVIDSATLKLYRYSGYSCTQGTTPKDIGVYTVSNTYQGSYTDWTETGLTWSNAPSITSGNLISTNNQVCSSNGYKNWDVTSAVESAHFGNGIVSLALKFVDETGVKNQKFYDDECGCASQRPKLEVRYSYPSCNTHASQDLCECNPNCDWCIECDGTKWSGGPNRCVDSNTCSYSCAEGHCGAQCDSSSDYFLSGTTCYYNCDFTETCSYQNQCSIEPYCIDNIRYYSGTCTPTGCVFDSENCDDYDHYDEYEYYCEDNVRRKHRLFHDFSCSPQGCIESVYYVDDQIVEDCDSYDYYEDYEYYCDGNYLRKHRLFHDFSCAPEGCVENVYYTDDQLVENCDVMDGNISNECGIEDWGCVETDGNAICQIQFIVPHDELCENYCDDSIRYFYGICNPDTYLCEYQTENCSSNSYYEAYEYYCDGNDRRKHRLFHDFFCSPESCLEDVYYTDDQLVENCDEYDYYDDYEYYCDGNIVKKHRLFHDFSCSPEGCVENVYYVNETIVENCDSMDGTTYNECGVIDYSCSQEGQNAQCVISTIDKNQSVCSTNFCSDEIRNYDGFCNDDYYCEYAVENCSSYDYYDPYENYCSGNELRSHRIYHDFVCSPDACVETTYYTDDHMIEDCGSYPNGWYNYGDEEGLDDPACEYRIHFCDSSNEPHCAYNVTQAHDYDVLDGNYCIDEKSIEERDYYCNQYGEPSYKVIVGPYLCGIDGWIGGGDTPGFGEDQPCVYEEWYCTGAGPNSYCNSTTTYSEDFDYLDNDNELCYEAELFKIDYWCNLESCDSQNPENGCSPKKKLYPAGCSFICGAECEQDSDCEDAYCNVTYPDYCNGHKLVEYDNDKILDNTTVTNFTENICLDDCTCTSYTVTCLPPPVNTYCVEGVCGAQCDDVSDFKVEGTTCYYGCDPTDTCSFLNQCSTESYCDGNIRYYSGTCTPTGCTFESENCDDYDYYEDYEYYCEGNNLKKRRLFHDFSCSPEGCVESVYYVDDQIVENCDDRDGEQHNECGFMDYSCLDGACVITEIIKNDSVCSDNFCSDNVRNYDGYCGDNYYCEYHQEDCGQYNGFYCVDSYVEQRDYYCTPSSCEYIVTDIEQCQPDGWYNYGNEEGLDDPTCEQRDYYCQDNGLNDYCTFDVINTHDYDSLDGYYCADNESIEQRDYYCGSNGQAEYEIISGPNSCGEDQWTGGGDTPGFGEDEACIYTDYYCTGIGPNSMCLSSVLYTVDFDNMDNTDICIGTKGTKIDYWCNLVTCDYENPLNGCSYGIGTYEMQCSFDCGAECEIDSDCPDSICNVTYQDYCDGRKLVEYNNNMMLDSVTVFNSTPNYCMECCCTCTENPVTCEAPPTNTYCVEGVCDAQCDDVSDFKVEGTTCYYGCDPTDTCMYEHFASMENYCDGSVRYFDAECSPSGVTFQTENCDDYDYYEYRIYCDGSIIKNQTIFHDFSCSPEGCIENIVTSEEIIENCDLMDGTTHNECGVMDYTCSEQNGQAQCVIYQINKNESACSNFCDNGVRNYNGFCNDEYFCEYATEDCESYDRVDEPEYYCDGSVVKSRQLFHDFSCTPNECEESTYYVNETVVEDCDDRDGELYHECGLTDWSCSLGACELVGIVKDESKCSTNFCSGDTRYYNGFCDQNYYCQYSTENCNAFDRYDSFVTYCRGNELWQHRLFHDFSCTPNECVEVSSEYVDDQFLEDCKENPDGWYNYGNDPCFEDPICEYRVYYCMENDNGAVCTYDITQSHNYNVKDGYYCADSKRIERRDYYCGKGGEEKYAVVEGPTSCGEDGWTGGGNIPGFGDDPACVFITNRCVPNSNNSYCDSTTSYSVDFDSKDEITCKGSKQGEHDFWCDISTCNVMHPSSGCSYGDTWYNLVCNFNCGAECEKDSDCSPHLENDICYYNGQCTDMCACDYMIETCPEPGTVQNNICYYGTRACGENGCVINSCELEEGEICDAQYGCLSCTDIGTVADKFSDGSYSKNITFNDGGINSSAKVLLPRNVTITGASIDVTGYPAYFSSKNVVAAVLVTDVSSSMQGEKLAKAKEADLEFVNLLLQNNGGNEIGLVSFSTKVTSYLELTNNQTELSNEIDSYYGNGFTCVSCGIKKATELLAEGSNQNKVMILMSDGVINRCIGGTTCFGGKQAIRKAMEAYENYGIKIYTISYGSDADYETMMKIANVTGGKHYFADENSIVDIYRLIAISISKTYPSNIVFNFGDIGTPEWEYSDYLNSTVHISDFQDNINDFLKNCDCPGCEIFDGYCNVYLTFSSETSGTLLLENLNITACSYYVPDGVQCFTCSDCGGGEDCTDYSEWSQWECDWSDVCDESATCQRTRTVRQYTCNNPGVGSYCTSTETVQTDTQIQTRNTDGTSCDDGQYCTINDQCLGGQCVGTEQRTCDDQNPCTDDYCDENLDECVFVPDDTNECGIFRICPEDGCVGLNWTIYPPSGHDYCLAGECIEYSCEPISSVYNPICEPDSDGDGIKDSEDACPDVYGTDCNGCPNPCQGCAVMICPLNGEPTCEADDTQCEPTQCPEDGCGLGSCRPYEWADYPDYVDNTCILNGNIGTCTQNTCDGLETCVYSEACVPQENVSNHVLLSEVFYDTPGSDQYEEWIELYNPTDKVVDISGWEIQDNSGSYIIPQNTVIFPNDTLVIAKDTEGFRNLYGFDPDISGMSLSLSNSGDFLKLINESGEVDMVAWENEITGWDLVANTNESIERVPINVDTDSPSDWTSHATPKPDTAKTKLNLTNFTIHLYKGINIISIPLSLENNSIEYVLSSIEGSYDVIRTYENGEWKTYDPNFPEISDLMEIIPGKGYIIFMNSDADLTIQGFEILTSTEIQLSTGWNLIGYPKLEIRNVENVLTPIEGKYAEIKTYNPIDGWRSYHSAHPETATLTMMSPGTGYWVYMNEDNILKIERII